LRSDRRAEDIAPAFEALKAGADALYVVGDLLVITHRARIRVVGSIGHQTTRFDVLLGVVNRW
jgi:hypothetical protein